MELTVLFDTPRLFKGSYTIKNYETKKDRLLTRFYHLILDSNIESRYPGSP